MLDFNEAVKDKVIAIIGCGGLGGNIAHLFARLNPKKIIVFDGDEFSLSNLNRQLCATKNTIGKKKVEVLEERLLACSNSEIETHPIFFTEKEIPLLESVDLILDATDNVRSRFVIEKAGKKHKIPVVHGAINGLFGQVAIIYPGDKTFEKLYPDKQEKEIQKTYSFAPSLIASIQVAEAAKYFAKEQELKPYEVLFIDMLSMDIKKLNI